MELSEVVLSSIHLRVKEGQAKLLENFGEGLETTPVPLMLSDTYGWQIAPFNSILSEFLASDRRVLLVTGVSGSGKSTATRMRVCDFQARSSGDEPIELWLPLQNWRNCSLVDLVKILMGYGLSSDEIEMLKTSKHPVHLFFDGFDEWGKWNNLYIQQKLAEWNIKVIFTCRRSSLVDREQYVHYFVPFKENGQRQMDLYQEATILPFSEQQVDAYLSFAIEKPRCPWETVREYREQLLNIPGLVDLLTTPLNLQLITSIFPGLVAHYNKHPEVERQKLTQTDLLKHFLDYWFGRQAKKLQIPGVSKEKLKNKLKAYAFGIAECFYREGVSVATYCSESSDLFSEDLDNQPDVSIWEQYFGDSVSPSWSQLGLITCDSGCYYRFIHPMIQDYLIARLIRKSIISQSVTRKNFTETKKENRRSELKGINSTDNGSNSFKSTKLSSTSKNDFLNILSLMDSSFISLLVEQVSKDSNALSALWSLVEDSKKEELTGQIAANAITILNLAKIPFSGCDFSGVRIPGADLRGAVCDGTDFSDADLRKVRWQGAYLRGAKFSNSKWHDANLGETAYLIAHRSAVLTIDVSSQEPIWIVSGGEDSSWILWNHDTGQVENRLYVHHEGAVRHIACHPDGGEVISAGDDGTIQRWTVGTENEEEQVFCCWQRTDTPIDALAVDFRGDRLFLVVGGELHVVHYKPVFEGERTTWKYSDASLLRTRSLLFDEKTNNLFCGQEQGRVTLFQAKPDSGEVVRTWAVANNAITGLALSPKREKLGVGTSNGELIIWSIQESICLHRFLAHQGSVNSLAFHPQQSTATLVSAGQDALLCYWSIGENGGRLGQWVGHHEAVSSVVFLPNGEQLVSASFDRTLRKWSLSQLRDCSFELSRKALPIIRLVSMPHEDSVLCINQASQFVIRQATNGRELRQLKQMNQTFAASIPVSSYWKVGGRLQLAQVDVSDRTPPLTTESAIIDQRLSFISNPLPHTTAIFSEDGKWLIGGTVSGDLQVVAIGLGRLSQDLPPVVAHRTTVTAMVWHSSVLLVTGDAGGGLMGWKWELPSQANVAGQLGEGYGAKSEALNPQLQLQWSVDPYLTVSGADFTNVEGLNSGQVYLLGQRGAVSDFMLGIGLRTALLNQDAAQVKRCLKQSPGLLVQILEEGKTPWQLACQYGTWSVIEACLSSPHFSVEHARETILNWQEQSVIELSASTADKRTHPLALALRDNVWSVVSRLCMELRLTLEELASLGWQSDRLKIPELTRALTEAVTRGSSVDSANQLLMLGVDPEAPTSDGLTPLMHASRRDCVPGVEVLLGAGVNLEQVDNVGNTALLHAAAQGKNRVLSVLLYHQANFNAVNQSGENALVRAAYFGHESTVKELLLSAEETNKVSHEAIRVVLKRRGAQLYRAQVVRAISILVSPLDELDLRSSDLGAEGAALLVDGLERNRLVSLDLRNSCLQEKGGQEIAKLLERSGRLKRLNVRSNHLGDIGVSVLLNALERNNQRTLEYLDVRDNNIANNHNSALILQALREQAQLLGITEYYDLYNSSSDDILPSVFKPIVPDSKAMAKHLLWKTDMYYQSRPTKGRVSLVEKEDMPRCRLSFGRSKQKFN